MSFIEKISSNSFLLHIYAKPNSKKQNLLDDDQYLIVSIQSKAIQNKANKEIISIFKKKLNVSNNQIAIITGVKTSNKLIRVTLSEEFKKEEIIRKLLA
ncbi:MAG: DUF167 domain-containing protein [Candidatus Hodarchaeota archaeon]